MKSYSMKFGISEVIFHKISFDEMLETQWVHAVWWVDWFEDVLSDECMMMYDEWVGVRNCT